MIATAAHIKHVHTHMHVLQRTSHVDLHVYASQYDPTRTTAIRNAFVKDMNKRFNNIIKAIREAIVVQDVFGLNNVVVHVIPPQNAFNFTRSSDKVSAFMTWFKQLSNDELLQMKYMSQLGGAAEGAWTNTYVKESYKRGVMRAKYEMKKVGKPMPDIPDLGDAGLAATMMTPFHADRVGLMYTRTFDELKGITAAMDTQISRVLSQGMIDGDGPALLARKLTATITGPAGNLGITDTLGRFIPAKRRAEILARTEVIRTHHSAMMQEYRNWGIAGVKVKAEWSTAGDSRVCSKCAPLQGQVFTLDEIESMIPYHPQCRCIALPVPDEALPPTDEVVTLDKIPNEVTGKIYKVNPQDLTIPDYTMSKSFDKLVKAEMKAIKAGESLTPVFVDKANPMNIISGDWKAAAYKRLGQPIPITPINPTEYYTAIGNLIDTAEQYWTMIKEKGVVEKVIKKAVKAPKGTTAAVPEEVMSDKVAANLVNPEDQVAYLKYKKEYNQWFDETFDTPELKKALQTRVDPNSPSFKPAESWELVKDKLANKVRSIDDEILRVLGDWQSSTQKMGPTQYKRTASILEKRAGKMRVSKSLTAEEAELLMNVEPISTEVYLRMRAFAQSFMERYHFSGNKVKLWRGTDGKTGKKMREDLLNYKTSKGTYPKQAPINDAPLTGYTDVEVIGDAFGYKIDGVTARIDGVSIDEIFVPKQLLSWLTDRFSDEAEYLLIGRKRNFAMTHLHFRPLYQY